VQCSEMKAKVNEYVSLKHIFGLIHTFGIRKIEIRRTI
jgi:hypothetical protein